jgi:RNA polymerase sigma-70 factor (ECF subfamily)
VNDDRLVQHWPMIYRFLLFLIRNREDAEDLAQETFRVALSKGTDPQKGMNYGAWLRSIARNLARNHSRRRRWFLPDDFLDLAERRFVESGSDRDDIWTARRQALASCLERLANAERDLVRRRYESGEKVQDMARQLGLGPNTVSKRLERIRQQLAQCIERKAKGVLGG